VAAGAENIDGKIRILFVIDALVRGGKERRMVELLKALVPLQRYDIEVAILSDELQFKEILQLPIRIHQLVRRSKKDPFIASRLFQVAKLFDPHIIHVWDSMSAVYALTAAKVVGAKLLNAMITDADPNVRPFRKPYVRSRLTFPFSDIVLANSHAGLAAYKAPVAKSRVIHGGFNPERARVIQPAGIIRKQLDIRTPEIVGMVAAFEPRKDYRTFLESAVHITHHRPSVTFVAVGGGEQFDAMKQEYEAKYDGRIVFAGYQMDVQSIINTFDVGVLLSDCSCHGEGISNSILEYMGQGKPVVATDCGGTNEIVIDGATGFLVGCAAVHEVISQIIRLLNDSALARLLGSNGQRRVNEEFSLRTMVDRYMSLYDKLVLDH